MKYRINFLKFFFCIFPIRFEIFSVKMTIPESLKTSFIITCMACLNAVIWYIATACCDIIWYAVISYDMAWHDTTDSLTMIVYGNIIVRFIDICHIAILFVMLHHEYVYTHQRKKRTPCNDFIPKKASTNPLLQADHRDVNWTSPTFSALPFCLCCIWRLVEHLHFKIAAES